jgi:hypothetical protein
VHVTLIFNHLASITHPSCNVSIINLDVIGSLLDIHKEKERPKGIKSQMSQLVLLLSLLFLSLFGDVLAFLSRRPSPGNFNYQLCASQRDWVSSSDKVKALRRMLFESDELTVMPCCYDGLTARLVEQAGFNLTFMTGFGVSSTYGLPDTGELQSFLSTAHISKPM